MALDPDIAFVLAVALTPPRARDDAFYEAVNTELDSDDHAALRELRDQLLPNGIADRYAGPFNRLTGEVTTLQPDGSATYAEGTS
jgi:hypothetical protein